MNHTSILIHVVFSTRNRNKTLSFEHQSELFAYIGGTINKIKCKNLAVNGTGDHVHIFFDLRPSLSVSDFVKKIKQASSNWMKSNPKFKKFDGWQEGYFAGSVSPDGKDRCIKYIMNQSNHHYGKSFEVEMEWLKLKYEIEEILKDIKERQDSVTK